MANVITAGNSSNGGTAITTDTSGTLNTGRIELLADTHIHLPTRIYGATADAAGSIIIYN